MDVSKQTVRTVAVFVLALWAGLTCVLAGEFGNQANDSFNKAKKVLQHQVYHDHRITFYCGALFDQQKNITLPVGFTTQKHQKRAKKVEWEHIVPAENFGRTFAEWREGHPACVDSKGKAFKGRRCAEKVNLEYRYMQSDMYNLVPAIGAVNAVRSNYNFRPLPEASSDFGSCEMKIEDQKAEPPAQSRGAIARTYQYMEVTYPRYRMSRQQQQLMAAWDRQYPVTAFECLRTQRIEALQRNENPVVKQACQSQHLW